jgi:hypothetical protein
VTKIRRRRRRKRKRIEYRHRDERRDPLLFPRGESRGRDHEFREGILVSTVSHTRNNTLRSIPLFSHLLWGDL